MGVVNVTPDSFSDGGLYLDPTAAVAHALDLYDQGADWVDVGGESTRPGSDGVDAAEERHRVVPVIRGIVASRPAAAVSVDTSKAEVAAAAIEAGARMVNDVSALSDPAMGPLCAGADVEVVLMHMRGTPGSMQRDTHYDDLVAEVVAFLAARVQRAIGVGISPERILVDPGIGFGKAWEDNPALIAAVPRLASLGHRVVIGASRKRFIGAITGVEVPSQRVFGSVGAALAAARAGAWMVRVHDVAATRQALAVYMAVEAHWTG